MTATWKAEAEPITEPGDTLSLEQVMAETGLSRNTIMYRVLAKQPTSSRDPVSALARPRYELFGTPRWTREQVGRYFDLFQARQLSVRDEYAHLPTVTSEQARQQQLHSLRGIARTTGAPLTSIHRWRHKPGFPEPVARLMTKGPQPRVLYQWGPVREWLREFIQDHPNPRRGPVFLPEVAIPEQRVGGDEG